MTDISVQIAEKAQALKRWQPEKIRLAAEAIRGGGSVVAQGAVFYGVFGENIGSEQNGRGCA